MKKMIIAIVVLGIITLGACTLFDADNTGSGGNVVSMTTQSQF